MKRGFTLMEILLALLVVSIGIVSLIGLLVSTLDTNSKTRDDIYVVSFADMLLNHLHAEENWNNIPISGNYTLHDYNEQPATISIGTLDQFTLHIIGKDGNPAERWTANYILNLSRSGNILTAQLQVWPGYTTNGHPRTFQSEIYNWRKK